MKKIVYIAHPISWNIEWNIKKVLNICHEVHRENNNVIPIAPYIVSLQYLDDNIIEDRELWIESNTEHFKRKMIDQLWVYWDRISTWMEYEIKLAKKYKIPVFIKNKELELDNFVKNNPDLFIEKMKMNIKLENWKAKIKHNFK